METPSGMSSVSLTDSESDGELVQPFQPFRFLDLPSELRNKIYGYALAIDDHRAAMDRAVDVSAKNSFCIRRLLWLFLVSRQVHDEAYPVFFSSNVFRIFPTQ